MAGFVFVFVIYGITKHNGLQYKDQQFYIYHGKCAVQNDNILMAFASFRRGPDVDTRRYVDTHGTPSLTFFYGIRYVAVNLIKLSNK